jgi:hypothetical protein
MSEFEIIETKVKKWTSLFLFEDRIEDHCCPNAAIGN